MANTNYKPLQTGFSRAFIIEGRARGDHQPSYNSQLKMTGVTAGFGDIKKIEIPDPNSYDGFIEIDRVKGTVDRVTTSLVGRYAAAIRSDLLRLAKVGCAVDIQLHIGECTDPSAFLTFSKAVILEDVSITSWKTEDLGGLGSDERAKVDETADISAKTIYEVVPMNFVRKADDIVTNQILDVCIVDAISCGTCGSESDGCKKIFAVTKAAGGSATTPPDIVYSLDKGVTWKAEDVDGITATSDANGVAGVGQYIVVVSNADMGHAYALKSDFTSGIDPAFTKVTTGYNSSKPNAIWSVGSMAFVVGDGGYVLKITDPTAGATVLDAGVATMSKLNHVHALDSEHAVACGNDGTVVYTTNGSLWGVTPTRPVGNGTHLNSIWMKSQTEWWVTTSGGSLYYTLNSGSTWTRKALPGTAPSALNDVQFSTPSVGFLTGVVSTKGRGYRTFDGGYSWTVLPESTSGVMPTADSFAAVAACPNDPNFVVFGGQYNTTDGILVVGNP